MSSDDPIGARQGGSRAMSRMHCRAAFVLVALAVACPATAQEDHSGLTLESYRRKCLMCHSRAAPEGISPDILAGLHPEPGLRPADVMPGVTCWRRCTTCWPPAPAAKAPANSKPANSTSSSAPRGRAGFARKAASLLRWRAWAIR